MGATQNNNESVNSLLWVRCPKYHDPKSVRIAVALAVLNNGHMSKVELMKKLSIPSHKNGQDIWEKRDKKNCKSRQNKDTEKTTVWEKAETPAQISHKGERGSTVWSWWFWKYADSKKEIKKWTNNKESALFTT